MQSVLRPQNSSATSRNEAASDKLPASKRPQRRVAIHWGALAVAGLALWFLGGVAWWQFQWWQPAQDTMVGTDNAPAQRIAEQGNSQVR